MKEPDIELLERYFSGSASAQEITEIDTWLRKNNIDAGELELLLTLPEGIRFMLSLDPKKDWISLKQKLPAQKSIFFQPVFLRAAAAITLIMVVASVFYLTMRSGPDKIISIVNTERIAKKITLPDSSVVYLNTGAELNYRKEFSEERTMTMSGEAFFDVKRNPSLPFTVTLKNCQVEVLGTSFNILEDSSQVEVAVATGKVSFQSQDNTIFLEKGDKGVYADASKYLRKESGYSPNYLSWKTGVLEFVNTPLDEAAADIEKHFGVKITIKGAQKEFPAYTSRFDQPSLNEILEEMKLTLAVQYTVQNKKITITIKK